LKTNPEKLENLLARGLANAYLISGEDPLTAGEAADQLRAAARAQGFTEREVFFVERANSGPWDQMRAAAQALSLFAARRILEIRIPGGKPGAAGEKVLVELAALAGPELLLLVITGELDWQAKKSSWVQGLDAAGVWVEANAVPLAQLPAWIRARAARAGIAMDEAAVEILVNQCEGNPLAAMQEITKLSLAGISKAGAPEVLASVAQSSRFDLSQLGEALLRCDRARALRVLAGLRAEGVEPPLILWSIVQELRALWVELVPGPPVPGVFTRNREALRAAVPAFRRRGREAFARLTERAARADRISKGQQYGNAWDELALLVSEFASGEALLVAA